MTFTSLHRALGLPPGPLTDQMLDEAVAAAVTETADLDWKSSLPPARGLRDTDFPKDVAAMANGGGGLIVYGVTESQKAATGRVDVGELSEADERTFVRAAVTTITPPVFGLAVHQLGEPGKRAVAIEVPASVDGPHLIYRSDYFGAPLRNGPDTVWMHERQIEAAYRARFDERRHATEALDRLYVEASAGRQDDDLAWLIAVAHPRVPRVASRLSRDEARALMQKVEQVTLSFAADSDIHPIKNLDQLNPRNGLRRWVFVNTATSGYAAWKEAWASIHYDGSVTLATRIGGHPLNLSTETHANGWELAANRIECATADIMALIRVTGQAVGATEYDVRVGINWAGSQPLIINPGNGRQYFGGSVPIRHFTPVETTVDASASDLDYHWQVHDLAEDCVNQGGIPDLRLIEPPERPA